MYFCETYERITFYNINYYVIASLIITLWSNDFYRFLHYRQISRFRTNRVANSRLKHRNESYAFFRNIGLKRWSRMIFFFFSTTNEMKNERFAPPRRCWLNTYLPRIDIYINHYRYTAKMQDCFSLAFPGSRI